MHSRKLRVPIQALAALALMTLPTNSQEGSCQGDVDWAETIYSNPPVGPRRRIIDFECVSFGCTTNCSVQSVAGEYWNWKVCSCGEADDLDCCTLLWHAGMSNVYFSTTGTCPPCGESGTCSVKTITVYSSTGDGSTTYLRETVALCSG